MDWYAHDAWVLGTGKKSQGWDANHCAFPTCFREVVGPHMVPPASQVTHIHSSRCAVDCKKQRLTISVSAGGKLQETEGGRERGGQLTDSRAWEEKLVPHTPPPVSSLYKDKGMNRVSKAGGCV